MTARVGPAPRPPISARTRVVDVVFLICLLIPAGLMVLFIVGSLLFTGAQVGPDKRAIYGQAWSWPVFPVPVWLTFVPAAVAAVVVVPLAVVLLRSAQAQGLIGRWGQSGAAAAGTLLFALEFPAQPGDSFVYSHQFAAKLSGCTFAVLFVAFAVVGARSWRTERPFAVPAEPVSRGRIAFGVFMTLACAGSVVWFTILAIRGWARVIAGRPENLPLWIDYDLHVGGAVFSTVMDLVFFGFTALCAGLTASFIKSRRHPE